MNRLAVFIDPSDLCARILLPELLQAISVRTDICCVALLVVDSEPLWRLKLRWSVSRSVRRLQVMAGSGRWDAGLNIPPLDISKVAAHHGISLKRLPSGDPNHPAIQSYIAQDVQANLAINMYCKRLFRQELLGRFEMTINYHNGFLPTFRGLRASNWSIYMGLPASGYSFHLMDSGFDTGNILLSGDVPVKPGDTAADLEVRKAIDASDKLPELLEAMTHRNEGHPQVGIACSHDRNAFKLATFVTDPSALSSAELQRRLAAFLRINILIGRHWWPVTEVEVGQLKGYQAIQSADGQWLSITGLNFWPARWVAWRFVRHTNEQ